MAYRLRVYGPTPQANTLYVYDGANNLIGAGTAAGTGTPCIDITVESDIWVQAYLNAGYSITNWVVSGASYYTDGDFCRIPYNDSYTNVFVRVETSGGGGGTDPDPGETTLYAYLAYNANGGTGAPTKHMVSGPKISGTANEFWATVSGVVPIRSGYTFNGWWLYNIAEYGTFWQGQGVRITGTEGSPSATPHTLYAQWKKGESVGGGVYIDGELYDVYIDGELYDAYIDGELTAD